MGRPAGNRGNDGGVRAPVKPLDRPPAGSGFSRAPDEVQHVAPRTTAEAVEPLRVAVDREAALGLVVERADALGGPCPFPSA